MNALAEVLIGRDREPAWRGAATRRTAVLAGWLGWVVLALSGLVAVTVPGHGDARRAGLAHGPGDLAWLAVGLAVAAALPLAPRFALLAWRVAFLGVLITPLIPGQTRADAAYYVVLAVTVAVAGVRYGPRCLWWMLALSLVPVWLWTGPDWVYPAVNTAWLCLLAAMVHAVTYWRRYRRALAEQTENAERQGERNTVLEERARIAREMHDVVAHHMSLIAVQAETAQYRLAAHGTETPEPVAAEFAALSAAAREALTEMRRLLGVLRSDGSATDNSKRREGGGAAGGSAADRAPQPRLEDVAELVETACRAGARVTLTLSDSRTAPVPPGVGLAAYRIVQESLSNAARHAPRAAVRVRIERTEGSVRVLVENGPAAAPRGEDPGVGPEPAGPEPAGDRAAGDRAAGPEAAGHEAAGDQAAGRAAVGHGLTGMRERAALLRGTLDAGPTGGGGFAVRAVLPAGDPVGGSPDDQAGGPARETAPAHAGKTGRAS